MPETVPHLGRLFLLDGRGEQLELSVMV
jgi:hypothetical protein